MSAQILIVDDDPVQRRLLEGAANRLGYSAQLCDGGEAALEAMSSEAAPFDAILLDLVMPDIDGLEVMHAMRERDIETPVIVLTAQGGIEVVISAMRAGAFDFSGQTGRARAAENGAPIRRQGHLPADRRRHHGGS
jgi:DNA-binding NtrC family response regulator